MRPASIIRPPCPPVTPTPSPGRNRTPVPPVTPCPPVIRERDTRDAWAAMLMAEIDAHAAAMMRQKRLRR